MARTPIRRSASHSQNENDPRPAKRARLDLSPPSSPLTEIESSQVSQAPLQLEAIEKSKQTMRQIPPQVLLLSIPSLLMLPPSHPQHTHSLRLSLTALRKCVLASGSTGDIEVEARARVAIVEVGMRICVGGLGAEDWAKGLVNEVSQRLTLFRVPTNSKLFRLRRI